MIHLAIDEGPAQDEVPSIGQYDGYYGKYILLFISFYYVIIFILMNNICFLFDNDIFRGSRYYTIEQGAASIQSPLDARIEHLSMSWMALSILCDSSQRIDNFI